MRKRIVSSLLLVGLLGALGAQAYGVTQQSRQNIKHFTAFFSVAGKNASSQNDIKAAIAEKIGADCEENWLVGQSKEEALNSYIASGEYPDFISGEKLLLNADALIPIDEYWDDYPNIRNYLTDVQWDRFRQDDGHIYWIPQFCVTHGQDMGPTHNGEAFWIQARVLKWAGYPKITTVDEYFDLLDAYAAANPTMEDGTKNIPFTVLCDDWRFFCLENVPQFLDGYPNDGCCMVDPVNKKVLDYNTTETAKRYFKRLNEEYQKGMFDPESFTSTYEEYLNKLSSGAVLGMVDQWWQFYYNLVEPYESNGLSDLGCDYIPLPIMIDEGMKNQWNVDRSAEVDTSSGLSITVSCQDIAGALQFVNDLLDSDITRMRFWGEEGLDYLVDENGMFYMDEEQGKRHGNAQLNESHFCSYGYFPRVEGLLDDGINAFSMEYQPNEYMKSLKSDVRECFEAYGVQTYVELFGANEAPGDWYPMYSYSQSLAANSRGGAVRDEIDAVKRNWLPQVIMSDDFDAVWAAYMDAYQDCDPEVYFDVLQEHLDQIDP